MAEEKIEKKVEEAKKEKEESIVRKPKEPSKSAVEKSSKKGKKDEKKERIELEREYIIPLRREILKAPRYRRAKKAIRAIRKFLARHMRIEDRDEKKIKIDRYLNEEIWFRGIKKPATKIKVKAVKKDGIVYAELVEIPEKMKFAKAREEKRKAAASSKNKPKIAREEKKEEQTEEKKTDEKEKERASVEAGLKRQEVAAKQAQHTAAGQHKQKTMPVRKSLKK